jgi:hypothetical protein
MHNEERCDHTQADADKKKIGELAEYLKKRKRIRSKMNLKE